MFDNVSNDLNTTRQQLADWKEQYKTQRDENDTTADERDDLVNQTKELITDRQSYLNILVLLSCVTSSRYLAIRKSVPILPSTSNGRCY